MSWFKIRPRKDNCTLEDLPHTRREEFFDILKNRNDLLFFFGLSYLFLAIPFALVFFLSLTMKNQFYLNLENQVIDKGTYMSEAALNAFYKDLLYLPCLLLFDLGISASLRIYRKLGFEEPLLLWGDILRGIKDNYVSVLLTSLVLYLGFFLSDIVKAYLPLNPEVYQVAIAYIPTALFMIVILPSGLFAFSAQAVYQDKWRKIFRNSMNFAISKFWCGALFGFLFAAPFLLLELGATYVSIIFLLVYFLLYLPLLQEAFTLYSLHVFDELINQEQYPNLYQKGLYESMIRVMKEEKHDESK